MHTKTLLAVALATLTTASPISSGIAERESSQKNSFSITNFVFGCTTTCDWSFDVTNAFQQLPGHPAFKKPVHCKGSKGVNTAFEPVACGSISKTQQVAAYIDADNKLHLQYKVNVPSNVKGQAGATYWYEGDKVVGAQTGNAPSPPNFSVPETKAYAIA